VSNATRRLSVLACLPILALAAACERDVAGLDVSRAPVDPLVFDDALGADVFYQPFFETYYDAMTIDDTFARDGFAPDGARSLRFAVAPTGAALGAFTGGVLTSAGARDLADFNALTFWARSDVPITLNTVGFGNDNTGTSKYEAGRSNIPLTPDWTFHVVPIPDSSKLIAERGLFTLAEGPETAEGYGVYFDDIRFAKLDDFEVFRVSLPSANRGYFVGSDVFISGTSTIFLREGAFLPVNHSPSYLEYLSSDVSVLEVSDDGAVRVVGEGTAQVTARLGEVDAFGTITVTAFPSPAEAAPAPTLPASDVISMFSDAYDDVPVDTWRTSWSNAQLEDFAVAGNNTRMYSALVFVGIEFLTSPIDASDMDFLHMDVYAPAGSEFRIEVVSFPGESGVLTQRLDLKADTTPAFRSGEWVSLDIPLDSFVLPEGFDWSRIGQIVLSTPDAQLVLVDNVYWHK